MTAVGLVLGSGGLHGAAQHAGALAALVEATGWDPRTADVVVGTSAGATTAVRKVVGSREWRTFFESLRGSLKASGTFCFRGFLL